ncbi:MAG: hypothetical protein KJN93_02685, partial [Alphaproteobacteria bacterium]|nr:hypothetical protein [Alphaproteobacteria bacterium]
REEGVKYVAALSQPLDSQSADVIAFEAKEREAAIAAPVDLIDEATLVPKTPAPPAAAAPDAAEAAQAETPASETDPLEAAEPEPAAPDTGPATEMASGPGAAPAAKPEAAEAEPDATEPAPVSDAPARIHFGSSRAAGADDTADPELPFLGSRGGVPELERELDPEIAAEAEAARAVTAEPDMTEPAAAEPASAEAQPAPGIPATPDVPEHDPEDTDPGYPAAPGVAARLGTVAPKELAAHKAALSQICDELAALRQRMG